MNNLGFYLLLSLLLNLLCFAPLMTFLLTRPSHPRPPQVHTVQVRLLQPERKETVQVPPPPPKVEPPKPRPVAPPPRVAQTTAVPPAARPKPRPVTSEPPEVPQAPRRSTPRRPQASARPTPPTRSQTSAFQVPSRPQTSPTRFQPGPIGPGNPGPVSSSPTPEPATEPAPANPPVGEPAAPETPPSPAAPEPPQQPQPEPSPLAGSQGSNPKGVIPDKPASPRGNFPNSNIRAVLRKLGSKTFVRVGLRIHPDGHIDVEILTGSGIPELDQAVLKDLRGWRWDPAEVAGKPVITEKPIRIKLEAD